MCVCVCVCVCGYVCVWVCVCTHKHTLRILQAQGGDENSGDDDGEEVEDNENADAAGDEYRTMFAVGWDLNGGDLGPAHEL